MKSDREKWDRKYQREEFAYGKKPNPFLKSHLPFPEKGSALDLACGEVRVRVIGATPGEMSCNLPEGQSRDEGELLFQSRGEPLPAGHVIRVELGRLPVPLTAHARWFALVILVGLMGGTSISVWRRSVARR